MKKLIAAIATLGLLATPIAASAATYHLSPAYQAVYCYPTGSYWATQRAAYPAYYAAYGSFYNSLYGPGTIYCP